MRVLFQTIVFPLAAAAQAPIAGKPTVCGTPVRMHQGIVNAVAFSANGALALSMSNAGDLSVWDAKTGKRVSGIACGGAAEGAVFCGAKNERLAVVDGGAGGIRLFDARTGKPAGAVPAVIGIAVSADQTTLASTTAAGELVFVEAMTAKKSPPIAVGKKLFAPCFSPDGNTLLVDEFLAGKTYVVDRQQKKVVGELALARLKSERAFLPDGKTLVVMSGAKLRKVAVSGGDELGAWSLSEAGTSMALRHGADEVLVGDLNGAISHVDLASGEVKSTMHEHRSLVGRLAVSPDGKTLLSGSWDGSVRFWELESGKPCFTSPMHNNAVTSLAIGPDGKSLASGSWDNSAILWSADGKLRTKCTAHEYMVTAVGVQADGSWWSASQDATIRHHAVTGEEVGKIELKDKDLYATGLQLLAGDKVLLAGMSDGTLRWFDTASGAEQRSIDAHQGGVVAVAADAPGTFVATAGADRKVVVWDVATFAPKHSFAVHEDGVTALVHLGGGAFAASAAKGTLVRLDGAAGKETHRVTFGGKEAREIACLGFAPGRDFVFAGSGRKLCWLAAADLRAVGEVDAPSDVTVMAACVDGASIAAGLADGTVALWKCAAAVSKPKR